MFIDEMSGGQREFPPAAERPQVFNFRGFFLVFMGIKNHSESSVKKKSIKGRPTTKLKMIETIWILLPLFQLFFKDNTETVSVKT